MIISISRPSSSSRPVFLARLLVGAVLAATLALGSCANGRRPESFARPDRFVDASLPGSNEPGPFSGEPAFNEIVPRNDSNSFDPSSDLPGLDVGLNMVDDLRRGLELLGMDSAAAEEDANPSGSPPPGRVQSIGPMSSPPSVGRRTRIVWRRTAPDRKAAAVSATGRSGPMTSQRANDRSGSAQALGEHGAGPTLAANYPPDSSGINAVEPAGDADMNDPMSGPSPPSLGVRELVVLLSQQLLRDAAYSPAPLREHLVLSTLAMLDPERKLDVSTLHDLTDDEREILDPFQEYFSSLGSAVTDLPDAKTLAGMARALSEKLEGRKDLRITAFELCLEVFNYGNYTKRESNTFLRGRPHDLVAYVELENFTSTQSTDGAYLTNLTQQIDLYTWSDGTLVYSVPPQIATDRCRNRRRDFYIARIVSLPANLNVGKYRLKVRIRDEASEAEAEAVLPITIVATGDVAAAR